MSIIQNSIVISTSVSLFFLAFETLVYIYFLLLEKCSFIKPISNDYRSVNKDKRTLFETIIIKLCSNFAIYTLAIFCLTTMYSLRIVELKYELNPIKIILSLIICLIFHDACFYFAY